MLEDVTRETDHHILEEGRGWANVFSSVYVVHEFFG